MILADTLISNPEKFDIRLKLNNHFNSNFLVHFNLDIVFGSF